MPGMLMLRSALVITKVGFCLKAQLLNGLHHTRQALCGRLELIRCQDQHGSDACFKRDCCRVHSWHDLQARQEVHVTCMEAGGHGM